MNDDENNSIIPAKARRAAAAIVPFTGADLAKLPQVTEPTAHPPCHVTGTSHFLTVRYQLVTGPSPTIQYYFSVANGLAGGGYVLYAFHSTTGLADPTTHQLLQHGRRIGSYGYSDGSDVHLLDPGPHFFTFLLWRAEMAGAADYYFKFVSGGAFPTRRIADTLQFGVHVPSVEVATRQVKQVTAHVLARVEQERAMKLYRAELGLEAPADPVEQHREKVRTELNKKEASREVIGEHFEARRRRVREDGSLTDEEKASQLRRIDQQMLAELRSRSVY